MQLNKQNLNELTYLIMGLDIFSARHSLGSKFKQNFPPRLVSRGYLSYEKNIA